MCQPDDLLVTVGRTPPGRRAAATLSLVVCNLGAGPIERAVIHARRDKGQHEDVRSFTGCPSRGSGAALGNTPARVGAIFGAPGGPPRWRSVRYAQRVSAACTTATARTPRRERARGSLTARGHRASGVKRDVLWQPAALIPARRPAACRRAYLPALGGEALAVRYQEQIVGKPPAIGNDLRAELAARAESAIHAPDDHSGGRVVTRSPAPLAARLTATPDDRLTCMNDLVAELDGRRGFAGSACLRGGGGVG